MAGISRTFLVILAYTTSKKYIFNKISTGEIVESKLWKLDFMRKPRLAPSCDSQENFKLLLFQFMHLLHRK